jgi:hypothetical protein
MIYTLLKEEDGIKIYARIDDDPKTPKPLYLQIFIIKNVKK